MTLAADHNANLDWLEARNLRLKGCRTVQRSSSRLDAG